MFFLRNAWLIPAIPGACFWLILFFGRRMPGMAPNTLRLMVGWELVGVCSFMLIGHWWEEEVNSAAAIKAFITTRIGDVGLMLGIIVLFFAAGKNFDIARLNRLALTGGIS